MSITHNFLYDATIYQEVSVSKQKMTLSFGILVLVLAACAPQSTPLLPTATPPPTAEATNFPQPSPTPPPTATPAPTEEPQPGGYAFELVEIITGSLEPFAGPVDLDFNSIGELYVLDSLNNRVVVLDFAGNYVTQWGQQGSGEAEFELVDSDGVGLGSLAIDYRNGVFVADTLNRRIQKFGSDGAFQFSWDNTENGGPGFDRPYGIAVDLLGDVYVIDDGDNRLYRFEAIEFTLTDTFGIEGSGPAEFYSPAFPFVDLNARICVADFGNDRVQIFAYNGQISQILGESGAGPGQFSLPADVAVDDAGIIYVADFGNNRIQAFDAEGNYLAQWGSLGAGDDRLDQPTAVVYYEGYLYVADYGNNRIVKLRLSDGT